MRVKNPLRLCGELSLRNVLGRGSAALGLIVLAFPGGEDGSRPERKKFLGQIFYCPAYCIGNDMIAVGGKDKGERMKDKTVIVIRDRVRKRTVDGISHYTSTYHEHAHHGHCE